MTTAKTGGKEGLVRLKNTGQVGLVDREAGVIFGVSMITANREASGHEMYIDETMLNQVVEAGQEKSPLGLKARFDHPNACSRAMGTFVGRFLDVRRDDEQARGDLHISEAAAISPDGDLREYIMTLAEDDPAAFATSIVFRGSEPFTPDKKDEALRAEHPEDSDPFWFPHARLAKLQQCDVVDEGAANDSLFGRPNYLAEQMEKWANEHDGIIAGQLGKWFAKHHAKLIAWEEKIEMKEAQAEITELKTEIGEIEEELKTTKTAHEAANEINAKAEVTRKEAFDGGIDQGIEQAHGQIKQRMDKYADSEFVLAHLDMTATELSAEWDKIKKAEGGDGGTGAVGTTGGDADKPGGVGKSSYDERRKQLIAEGKDARSAAKLARKETEDKQSA